MKVTDEMRKLRDDGASYRAIAQHVGKSYTAVQEAFADDAKPAKAAAAKPQAQQKTGALTMAKILAQFNTTDKIIDVINSLPADEFKRAAELVHAAGITSTAWDKAKKHDKIKACQVRLPDGSYVYGKRKDADALRKQLMEV